MRVAVRVAVMGVLLAGCAQALAQQENYRFTQIDNNQGLSHNQVTTLLRDGHGFLWVGTASGLNRYDGYRIRVFRHEVQDSATLPDNNITKLYEGPEGRIIVKTARGFSVYNPDTETFNRGTKSFFAGYALPDSVEDMVKDSRGRYWSIHLKRGIFVTDPATRKSVRLKSVLGDTTSPDSSRVASVREEKGGAFWVIHKNGIIERIDGTSFKVIHREHYLADQFPSDVLDYNLMLDRDGDLWIFSNSYNQGAFYFNTRTRHWTHLAWNSSGWKLNTNIVRGIVEDNDGKIWIGTDHGGINLISKTSPTIQYLLHNDEDEKSIGQNSITTLYKDSDGIIWAGTYKKGISYYHKNVIRFQRYKHRASDPTSLSYDDVNRFAEDASGNLWIGTNGGGLIFFDRAKGTFRQYLNHPNDPGSLSSNVIVSMLIDRSGKLWLGTYFGGLEYFDGKKFIHYRHDARDPGSISDDSIWELFQDSQDNIWIGTLSNGLDLYDPRKGIFTHYKQNALNSVRSNYISAIAEDREGSIWFGTAEGIDVLDRKSGRFTHISAQPDKSGSLSNNQILTIVEDHRGQIWIGTPDGLNLYAPSTKTFRTFRESDGLPHNTVLTILEDDNGELWMSTSNGISNLKISDTTYRFKNYDESDGLQGRQFNENAALKTSGGEMIFGGANGFNIFRPRDIGINKSLPRVMLSDFQLFNKSIRIGEEIDGKVILQKPIGATQEITLEHDQNVISIELAALNFLHPEKNAYKYRLEEFNKDWLYTDGRSRKVTYTNLNPGEYTFSVMAANNDGFWNEEPTRLKITILSPFWQTKAAFLLYGVVVIGLLYLSRRVTIQRVRAKFRLEQERREAQRMHDLDMMKIRFFTNVSHEFRTPLTLILTPLEKLIKHASDTSVQNQYQMIHRNARRLLNLVNQLLDFRRMDVKEVRFNPSEGDIVSFIREIVHSFTDLSEKKGIQFSFRSNASALETIFDQDKLERILFNLLSNAFKFTPDHGRIDVVVTLQATAEADTDLRTLQIAISDTGIGIPADKLDKIFERFFQNTTPDSIVNQGSGIGLSIAREFVSIHGGTLTARSEQEKGSCFTILLPLKQISGAVMEPIAEEQVEPLQTVLSAEPELENILHGKKHVVLLVEDNEDFRFYLKDNLREHYTILEARNGKEGWQQTLAEIPDLVVSDVMMPEINGIDLCKKIKTDPRTSHIPVILLTARTAEEQKVEGFQTGASDYITKPFNFEILLSRIRNLIVQQELLRKAFQKHIGVQTSEVEITSLDDKLIYRAIKYVEESISNPDFSVEDLSHELGISRVYLYKKLVSLTGKSPLEFIRTVRLQRAAQLLEKSQLTVAEVAYQVGFNNPKYFARYFKMEFNVLPSVYAGRINKGTPQSPKFPSLG